MAFQVSPGVNVTEIDLSTVVPAVSTSTGAIAGPFRWGPVNERILVSSEVELARRFGSPKTGYNIETFFTAADFLAYSNSLYVARVSDGVEASILGGSIPVDGGVEVTASGTGYTQVPTVTFNGGGGTGATAEATLKVLTVVLGTSAGADYVQGDVVTVDLGAGIEAEFTVDTVDGTGAVTALTILNVGSYSNITAVSLEDVATTGGSGTGLVIDVTLGVNTIDVTDGGSAYTSAPTVVIAGNGINAAATASIADTSVSAKYPGVIGNTLAVEVITAATFTTFDENDATLVRNRNAFDSAPIGTNVHVVVIDAGGLFSGVAGTVLEAYPDLSITPGTLSEDGSNNYATSVINQRSDYIKIDETVNIANIDADLFTMQNGTDGSGETDSGIVTLLTGGSELVESGYELFKSAEDVDVSFLIQGKAQGANGVVLAQTLQNIAEYRKDAIAFISPRKEDVVNVTINTALTAVKAFRDASSINSSYVVMDSGYKYRYDKYNDQYVWTPLNGDIAGLCARTDNVRDPWFSPAGYNRGFIKNVIKLAYNPNKTHRDELYKKGVNPVITQPGQGTLLFGDKTMQAKSSAFDRINVRRLFIVLEKAIATASKFTLFEFNDDFTRAQFKNLVEPFLRDVQGRRGIYDFRVVCDETNNTSEVVDGNRFVGDIYIKPARSINFIQLNFVAVRSGVEFEEIAGQF